MSKRDYLKRILNRNEMAIKIDLSILKKKVNQARSNLARWMYQTGRDAPANLKILSSATKQTLKNPLLEVGKSLQQFPNTAIKPKPIPFPVATSKTGGEIYSDASVRGTGPGMKKPIPKLLRDLSNKSGAITEFTSSMVGEQARHYGQTFEKLSMPKGRKELFGGAKELAKTKPELSLDYLSKTISNPAVQAGLDITDFLPGGLLFSGGMKAVGREAVEKVAKEAGEKVIREGTEKVAREGAEKTLVSSIDDLVREGKNAVQEAIASGDEAAARAIHSDWSVKLPAYEELADEVAKTQGREIAEAAVETSSKYGVYQPVVNKMRNFLRISGEKKSVKTGELFREHIPRKVFGQSSDELAASLGKSENEFMSELTKDLNIISSTRPTKVSTKISLKNEAKRIKAIKSFKVKAEQLRPMYKKLDPEFYQIMRETEDTLDKELIKIPKGKTATAVLAEATPETLEKIEKKKLMDQEMFAMKKYKEWQRELLEQEGVKSTGQAVSDIAKSIKKGVSSAAHKIDELVDLPSWKSKWKDVYRNFKDVYGKRFPEVKKLLLDPFDESKGQFVKNLEKMGDELHNEIETGLGIKLHSKESAAVQKFGEGLSSQEDLIKQFGAKKAQNIMVADQWFRSKYNTLIDELNVIRKQIYPFDETKLIKYRKDYYRHFQELADAGSLSGLKNILQNTSDIPLSRFTRPKSKWLSFAQERLGMQTEYDAVGGYLDYIRAHSYAQNIDPHIAKFRNLANELMQETAADTANPSRVNGFIEFLNEYADHLAGKENPLDKLAAGIIPGFDGHKLMNVLNWFNNRTKANVILHNASVSLAQLFNIPQGVADAGFVNAGEGLARTVKGVLAGDEAMKKSDFLLERFSKPLAKFDRGILNNVKRFGIWMTQVGDEVGTKYIWNMEYIKGIKEGVENAVKYADDATRKLVAGRGIGEVPLAQRAKVFQMIAPFQLEVTNLWWVMGEQLGEKQFDKLIKLFTVGWLMNRGAEAVRGSGVIFDPIQAVIDAAKTYDEELDKKTGLARAGGRIAGEVLSNVPGGQTIAGMWPENKTKFDIAGMRGSLPGRREFFGREDPTRYGSGVLVAKAVQDPLHKLLPPFGGEQIRKTTAGVQTLLKEGRVTTKAGEPAYKVDTKNPWEVFKTVLFGPSSSPKAKQYYENFGKSKSEVLYQQFKIATPEEKTKMLEALSKNPSQLSSFKSYLRDVELKTSDYEKEIRNINDKPTKISRIKEELNKIKDPQERTKKIMDWYEKGIIKPSLFDNTNEEPIPAPSPKKTSLLDKFVPTAYAAESTSLDKLKPKFQVEDSTRKSSIKAAAAAPARSRTAATKNIPIIAQALKDQGIYSPEVLAYALATIEHETAGTFEPIEEYSGRQQAKRLGYSGGENYFGRGFIQLTHDYNYKEIGKMIGMGDKLYKNPQLALDPTISAKILAAFFKKTGVADLAKKGMFVAARRPVNPDNKGRSIASIARRYLLYLKKA